MNISKVIGSVEAQMSDYSGRIKVVAFRSNDLYVRNSAEITKTFPPEGYVFAPKFFEKFAYPLHSLVEFSVTASTQSKKGDTVLMDITKECKMGYPVVDAPVHIFKSDFSIDQPLLKSFIHEELTPFYINAKGALYGPFKYANGEVIPKVGKEVNKYSLDAIVFFKSGSRNYVVNEPSPLSGKIDCMTLSQLGDWLKQQLKNHPISVDMNALKKAFESQENNTLDKSRFERALKQLEHLKLNKDQLKEMASFSEKFQFSYQQALMLCSEEIQKEQLAPILKRQNEINEELEGVQQQIRQGINQRDILNEEISKSKIELEWLKENKERLIKDLSVHALIHKESSVLGSQPINTYEERLFYNVNSPYSNIEECRALLESAVANSNESTGKICYNALFQLKDFRCVLADNIVFIMQLAKISNNCKVFLQQVEPDWLKFSNLFNNGLKQACESAYANETMIHFLILEDINLASIECYGKPILDIVDGVRLGVPGLNKPWPNNLWLFGIPVREELPNSMGLPLLRHTFENWGCLPKSSKLLFNEIRSDRFLNLGIISSHNDIVSVSQSEYFPAI